LVETLDGLTEQAGDELSPEATAALRSQLEGEHQHAVEGLRQDRAVVEAVLAKLRTARQRTARWNFEADGFDALTPGLRRIYRRGRRGMRAAAAEPSTENLHEWRKRVKDLWHASQIMRPAASKRLKKLGKRAHRLSDLLGDDHDLAVLRNDVEAHPERFEDDEARRAFQIVIDRRRKALQQEAFEVGRGIFKQGPKQFVRKLERGWREHSGEKPQPSLA
jgi:CHAD domain-containing protein